MATPSADAGAAAAPGPTGLRIAIVGQGTQPIPAAGYAPVEKHIESLLGALRRRGEDAHLVNRAMPRFRFRLLLHALWAHRQLRRLRPDVVHCHSAINAWVLRRLGHRPVVFTTHSRQWTFNGVPGAAQTRELRDSRRAYRASDARIVLSEAVRAAVQRSPALRGLPCHVIPNGVDADRYAPPAAPRQGRLLVGVGLVAPVKRWHLLAQAARATGWSLEVVGPIDDPAYAQRILALNPEARLTGAVEDARVLEALQRARVLVHPSEAEAMSLAVLEGMAAGLPVLGSEVLRDQVTPGRNGLLVPEDPEEALVAQYRSILQRTPLEEWDRMGAAGRQRVLEAHAWDKVAERTCAVYREAAAAAGRRGGQTAAPRT